jgi:hypothetical protein
MRRIWLLETRDGFVLFLPLSALHRLSTVAHASGSCSAIILSAERTRSHLVRETQVDVEALPGRDSIMRHLQFEASKWAPSTISFLSPSRFERFRQKSCSFVARTSSPSFARH